MKSYTITVNGKEYDVTVEEKLDRVLNKTGKTAVSSIIQPESDNSQSDVVIPKSIDTNDKSKDIIQPEVKEEVAKKEADLNVASGSVIVKAGAAGKIVKIVAEVGKEVKSGDPVVILEAMKMETPVVAPSGGKVITIAVSQGDLVDAGAVLVTLN